LAGLASGGGMVSSKPSATAQYEVSGIRSASTRWGALSVERRRWQLPPFAHPDAWCLVL